MVKQTGKLKSLAQCFYMCFMVVYMIVREVVPLHSLIDNLALSVVIFLGGIALILWDLFTDRDCLKGRAYDLFAVFLVISVISSIVNYKYGVTANLKCIAAMVLSYFVFFAMGTKENKGRALSLILNTLIITLLIFVCISMVMYFFSIDYSVRADNILDQGFDTTWGRLWGVFRDPNMLCYIAFVSGFASVYGMWHYKKVWAYILYGLNILVVMTFIVLVVSRSALLILLTLPVICSIYPLIAFFKTDKKRAYGSVLLSVFVTAALFGSYLGLKQGIPYIKAGLLNKVGVMGREKVGNAYDKAYLFFGNEILNISANHVNPNQNKPNNGKKPEEIKRKDGKDDLSNGRFARWKGGIAVFKTTPIIGTSPRNAVAIAKERTPNTVMGKYGYVTHCSYLEILVNTGILGAVAMFGCLIYIAVLFIKAAVNKGFDARVLFALACFMAIAAGVFFVSDVFFVFTINTLLFFFFLGFLYDYAKTDDDGILYKWFGLLKGNKK